MNPGKLLTALRQIAYIWPRQTTAKISDVNGINDGRSRAILLESAVEIAREAVDEFDATAKTPAPFTPGDWFLEETDGTIRSKVWGESDQMADYKGVIICDLSPAWSEYGTWPSVGRKHAEPETRANARLIITAPYLYRVAKELKGQLAEVLKEDGGCDHSVGICRCAWIRACDEADSLIQLVETGTVKPTQESE